MEGTFPIGNIIEILQTRGERCRDWSRTRDCPSRPPEWPRIVAMQTVFRRNRCKPAIPKSEQSPAVSRNPESPSSDPGKRPSMERGRPSALVVQEALPPRTSEEPFECRSAQKPPSRFSDEFLHAGDTGDLIQFPLAKAVKPTSALRSLRHTDPQRALLVLINGLLRAITSSLKSASARPIAIDTIRQIRRTTRRHRLSARWRECPPCRNEMKPMPIEPIEQISAEPDAALPILKHRTEARV